MARARSRKRRPTGARRASESTAQKSAPAKVHDRAGPPGPSSASRRSRSPAAPTYGERPNAPWHPLPISELLILVGAIAAALGLARSGHDSAGGGRLLLVGLVAVGVGTIEVTLREHRSGYRSHTMMLAGLLVLVFDSILVLVLTAITSLSRLFSVGLIAIDFALFALLFKLLRARFLDARHARVIREG